MAQNIAAQVLADEIKKRVQAITLKEAELKDREKILIDRERRVTYREEMVTKREKKIYGQSNV